MSSSDLIIADARQTLRGIGVGAEIADKLDQAAAQITGEIGVRDVGVTARSKLALSSALKAVANLERWRAGTADAAIDADRFRRAAVLGAAEAQALIEETDPAFDSLRQALKAVEQISDFDQIAQARAAVAACVVPQSLIAPPRRARVPASQRVSADTAHVPRAAVVMSLGGHPITGPHAVIPGRVYQLTAEVRVLGWQDDANELVLRFLTRWPTSTIDVPEIRVSRPETVKEGVRSARGTGHLVLHASSSDPSELVNVTLDGRMVAADGSESELGLLGHAQLALRTLDPAVDVVTGAPIVDERIGSMLRELKDGDVPEAEYLAFGRFFGALVRAGVGIIADREFPEGSNPSEDQLQTELLKRLRMASELGGRLQEHAWQGGGATDLQHDGVVAELKVERKTPATLERAQKYVAQAAHYAAAGQRQVSILFVLDDTRKAAPPGVLANTVGWIRPSIHGLVDPAYPAWVGVIIVNANLPVPSSWSR